MLPQPNADLCAPLKTNLGPTTVGTLLLKSSKSCCVSLCQSSKQKGI